MSVVLVGWLTCVIQTSELLNGGDGALVDSSPPATTTMSVEGREQLANRVREAHGALRVTRYQLAPPSCEVNTSLDATPPSPPN